MGKFDFYVDQKATTWYRTHFEIEAESLDDAKRKAREFFDKGKTSDLPWEQFEGTTELMSVKENYGASTTEIYTEMGEMIYHNGDSN
jgi:hypothetical protein